MARKPRDTSAGIYHVFARSPAGELLFRDEHDFLRFEAELERIVSDECICVGACALHTHYHLILSTENGALSRAMQRLNQGYAGAFNARYERRGHAFAERYTSIRVESDAQLVTVYRYVMRNPVEAGLTRDAAEWRWSSYRAAIGLPGRFAFADASLVLEQFGGSVEQLREFVETPWESDRTAGSGTFGARPQERTAGSGTFGARPHGLSPPSAGR
jgi:REP element-mobilizing transposase RayT